MREVRSYGPHRAEDAPSTVTVLDDYRWPDRRGTRVRIPRALVRQRQAINNAAWAAGR